ncbi:MAG: hypothetical protein NTY19_13130 [Planctomycetota bacterium]|nr:hypothetical protein [Planctomycetota bacterium]
MYRIGFGSIVLLARSILAGFILAGFVVTMVLAQDVAQPRPLIGASAENAVARESPGASRPAAAVPDTWVRANRTASETADPAGPPASAKRSDPSSVLKSVLKKPVGTATSPATRSNSAVAESAVTEQPTLQQPNLEQAAPNTPVQTSSPPTGSVAPSSPGEQRAFTARRNAEEAAPQTLPNRIASKPVTSRRIGSTAGVAQRLSDAVVSSTGPLVRVDTKGPPAISVGEEATFVVTLANLGETEAKEVTVRIAIPEGVRLSAADTKVGTAAPRQDADATQRVVWTIERLPSRSEQQLSLKVVPTVNRPFELAIDWTMSPISATAQIEVQQPLLQMALKGPAEIDYGETKIFSIVLSNPGTGDAKNVAVELTLGSGSADTLKVGVLGAGDSKTFDVEVTARDSGSMQITANATGDNKLQAQASQALTVLRANLEVEAGGPAQQFSGAVATYQVKVLNTGTAVAKSVQAAVRLPRGVKYLKGLDNVKQLPEALAWSVGDLPPGGEQLYQFLCQLSADGDQLLRFGARTGGGIESASEVLTKVESVADLKLTVNDPKGPIPVGEEVTYEVLITNRGTKAAVEVSVLAQFSEGIEPVSAEGAKAEMMPGQVQFRPLAQIAPNETVKLQIKAKAASTGNHLFRAEVKCPDPETKLVAEQTTRYYGGEALVKQTRPATTAAPTPAGRHNETPRVGARRPGTIER